MLVNLRHCSQFKGLQYNEKRVNVKKSRFIKGQSLKKMGGYHLLKKDHLEQLRYPKEMLEDVVV